MLVLTRNPGDAFTIRQPDGSKIRVVILERRGRQIRVGIVAPKGVSILRDEILAADPEETFQDYMRRQRSKVDGPKQVS